AGSDRYGQDPGCHPRTAAGWLKAWCRRLRVVHGATEAPMVANGCCPVPGGPRAAPGAIPSLRTSTFRSGHDVTSLSRHALVPASLLG
ncbi:hypothetical protein, partial [Erwinia sp. ErVv1]|uniref:hypothetical protein n=1 Tax=Erwinia sp. ErVv1 TaxID=1603299 RepID=UPI001E3ED2B5